MATPKIVRCLCGHVFTKREVNRSDHSDEPFTFKYFGYTVRKYDDVCSMAGRRCPECRGVIFKWEEA